MTFTDRLIDQIEQKHSILCLGLDPQLKYIPPHLVRESVRDFGGTHEAVARLFVKINRELLDALHPFIIAVKPQIAFYEAYGHWGIWAFEETLAHARTLGLPTISDVKRGDGGDTAEVYARGHLGTIDMPNEDGTLTPYSGPLHSDAVTLQPGIGSACIQPFIAHVRENGSGLFLVTKTSFIPNSEVEQLSTSSGNKVWEEVAQLVQNEWGVGSEGVRGYRNVGVVAGATYPEEMKRMREILPNTWFLVPGVGAQGGSAENAVIGVNPDGFGCVINSSRDLMYAYRKSEQADAAERYIDHALKATIDTNNRLTTALIAAHKWPITL